MKKLLLSCIILTQMAPVACLPTKPAPATTDEKPRCGICLEDLDNRKTVLACKHGFHAGCINEWFRQGLQRTCPICKADQPETANQLWARNQRIKDEQIAYDAEMARAAQVNWDREERARLAGQPLPDDSRPGRRHSIGEDEAIRQVQESQREELKNRYSQKPASSARHQISPQDQLKATLVTAACILIIGWPLWSTLYTKIKARFKKKSQPKKSPRAV